MPNQIVLNSPYGRHDELVANAALSPGHLLETMTTNKVRLHSTSGGRAPQLMIAKEDALQGNIKTTAYAASDQVSIHRGLPGDLMLMKVPANQAAIVIGDELMSNGDGTLTLSNFLKRTVGVSVAESAEHENTITAADFDVAYTIAANTLKAGDIIRIKAQVTVNDNNSSDTLVLLLTLAGITIVTTGAIDVADGDIGYFEADVVVRAIGAAATAEIQATGVQALGVPGTVTAKPFVLNDGTNPDTTAAIEIAVNADWSVAHADNEASLSVLNVEIIRDSPMQVIAEAAEAVDNSAGGSEAFIKALLVSA